MRIVLAPYSTRLSNGNPNPKVPSLDFWHQVVSQLNALGHEVIQIGTAGEARIDGVSQFIVGWPLQKLREVVREADAFITIDSFLPHFVYAEKLNKRGVVLFSLSDDRIWGYPTNINLVKREYVRELQYQCWNLASYNADAFVSPDEVVSAVLELLKSCHNK